LSALSAVSRSITSSCSTIGTSIACSASTWKYYLDDRTHLGLN